MNVDELMKQAWSAVEKSGVPESLQAAAFKEAVDFLRSDNQVVPQPEAQTPAANQSVPAAKPQPPARPADPNAPIDENQFFENLAFESGASDQDLRDVLHLTDGKVQVIKPTRDLGKSGAEQARTVIALVAGARAHGLHEKPVVADAVRQELTRKNCYQPANFAGKHLGPLKGFNAGSNRSEILLGSGWVKEFMAAIEQAQGRTVSE